MPRRDRAPAPLLPTPRGRSRLPLVTLWAAACVANPDAPAAQEAAPAGPEAPPAGPEAAPKEQAPPPPRLDEDEGVRRAPFSLTASDGTGLTLTSVTARAVVDAPLAFTELHLVFDNPHDRTIEGRFEIVMPPGAAISRFAMKVRGAWQEGEVVERQAARVAYEDFLHRRQDPALLENNAGNAFSARVFPIAPRERKELIVSYSQELRSSAEPYRLPLRGLPELAHLDARVIVREAGGGGGAAATSLGGAAVQTRVIEVQKEKYMPDRDLEVPADGAPAQVGLRSDNLALARVVVAGEMPPAKVGALTVLFDTSASRALGFERQIARLGAVLRGLREASGEDFELRVIAFDQTRETIFEGKVSGLEAAHLDRLASRRPLGASDLAAALAEVAARPGAGGRLLVVSDGVATAGEVELADLARATRALEGAGFRRADAILDGGVRDESALKAITTGDLPEDGVVIDARFSSATIAHKLGSAALPALQVEVPGAAWVWPETVEGAQPGDEVLVYADLPPAQAMTVRLRGEATIERTPALTAAERPLLERAWVGARIARLQAERSRLPAGDRDLRDALQRTIVELSTRHRVLSDFTALLVLESDADYRRFHIDREALVDILTVGPAGVTLGGRQSAPAGPVEPDAARGWPADDDDPAAWGGLVGQADARKESAGPGASPPAADGDVWGGLLGAEVGEAFGVGGLGLTGTGRGGGGSGEGTIGAASPGGSGTGRSGGSGEGTIGLGKFGLVGRVSGSGSGEGYGQGSGAGFGGRGARVPQIRTTTPQVQGALDRNVIRRIVRAHINEIRACYNQALTRSPEAQGRVVLRFVINAEGDVIHALVQESTLADEAATRCMALAVRRWKFPRPKSGVVLVSYPFVLTPGEAAPERSGARRAAMDPERSEAHRTLGSPYTGKLHDVDALLKKGDPKAALALALAWREEAPGDVLALVALGEASAAAGDRETAARAYGSIIDLFPARADLRRHAGSRLEALGDAGLPLAVDTYQKAAASRPDHPSSHRLLAFALSRAGRHREAFEALERGLERRYPAGRFAGVDRILREDLGLLGAAWLRAEPAAKEAIEAALRRRRASLPTRPSTRFVLSWETDANDVDFHVRDRAGGHAYYASPALPSGGQLYADVTTGYGPECLTIPGTPKAFPYKLEAHYYSRGPMGYGMGKLEILQHDGAGELRFDERPFLIMKDRASVALGTLDAPL